MFEHLLFSFLLTTHFEGEWWGNMVILWLVLEGTPTVSTAAVPRHIPTSERTRFPTSLHPCQQLLFSTFLIASNLVNIKLTAVLIYISPATEQRLHLQISSRSTASVSHLLHCNSLLCRLIVSAPIAFIYHSASL